MDDLKLLRNKNLIMFLLRNTKYSLEDIKIFLTRLEKEIGERDLLSFSKEWKNMNLEERHSANLELFSLDAYDKNNFALMNMTMALINTEEGGTTSE